MSQTYGALISFIAHDQTSGRFSSMFDDDPMHKKAAEAGIPEIRIGVYNDRSGKLFYYDYDEARKAEQIAKIADPNSDGKDSVEYESARQAIEAISAKKGIDVLTPSSKRILLQGHGNGAADGIKGEQKYVSITNKQLAETVSEITNPQDRVHVAVVACDYANKEQIIGKRTISTTNAERLSEALQSSKKPGVTISLVGSTTEVSSMPEVGKVYGVSGDKKRDVWKPADKRQLQWVYDGISVDVFKQPLSTTATAQGRKQNILDFLKDVGTDDKLLQEVAKDATIGSFEDLNKKITLEGIPPAAQIQYKLREKGFDTQDILRLGKKLEDTAKKDRGKVSQNDAAYVALAFSDDKILKSLETHAVDTKALSHQFQANGAFQIGYNLVAGKLDKDGKLLNIASVSSETIQKIMQERISQEYSPTSAIRSRASSKLRDTVAAAAAQDAEAISSFKPDSVAEPIQTPAPETSSGAATPLPPVRPAGVKKDGDIPLSSIPMPPQAALLARLSQVTGRARTSSTSSQASSVAGAEQEASRGPELPAIKGRRPS